jgi:hypothetical protein
VKTEEKSNSRLFQHLLWAVNTQPARFKQLSDFQQWAIGQGFDAGDCRQVWNDLAGVYPKLYGRSMTEEVVRCR